MKSGKIKTKRGREISTKCCQVLVVNNLDSQDKQTSHTHLSECLLSSKSSYVLLPILSFFLTDSSSVEDKILAEIFRNEEKNEKRRGREWVSELLLLITRTTCTRCNQQGWLSRFNCANHFALAGGNRWDKDHSFNEFGRGGKQSKREKEGEENFRGPSRKTWVSWCWLRRLVCHHWDSWHTWLFHRSAECATRSSPEDGATSTWRARTRTWRRRSPRTSHWILARWLVETNTKLECNLDRLDCLTQSAWESRTDGEAETEGHVPDGVHTTWAERERCYEGEWERDRRHTVDWRVTNIDQVAYN